jgi:hypothetical protein
MKIKLHIPTEQYGFVEVEMEQNPQVPKTPSEVVEDAIELYNTSKTSQNAPGDGLDTKEFNRCVCEYLSTGELVGGSELYQQMSPSQQEWFQITKRAFKRMNK